MIHIDDDNKKPRNNIHDTTIIGIVIVVILSVIAIGLFVLIATQTAQATPTVSAKDASVANYKNYYKVGQKFNITVGGYVWTRFIIFTDGQLEYYIKMIYNGISSNGVCYLTINDNWDGGSTTLYVSKDTTFVSGVGKFKVLSYNQSTIFLEVVSWNPPSSDIR